MAEAKDLLKYLPEVVGYFKGRRNIQDEISRLQEQDPVQMDRIQMDPALANLNRLANTNQSSSAQETLDRATQEALKNPANRRNVAKILDAAGTQAAKLSDADTRQRSQLSALASRGNQQLSAQNTAIDRFNRLNDRFQEERVAGAEANLDRLNTRGLTTLGSIFGDAVNLIPSNENPNQDLDQLEIRSSQEIDQPEERTLVGSPQPVSNVSEILAAARMEDQLNDLKKDPTSGLDPMSLGLEQYGQDFQTEPIPGIDYEVGGAMVTPEGYDHDGVDINMTDAGNGKFLGSVEGAEIIVAAKDVKKGIEAAKKDPKSPTSKWFMKLSKRFRDQQSKK